MSTIGEALKEARSRLKQALTFGERDAGLEAHILLGHVLQQSRAYLIAHSNAPLSPAQMGEFNVLLGRRLLGEPVAYLIGQREFFGLPLKVTPDVLIPRPETELLVELALALIPEQGSIDVLDLGTGSGAIALALAKHRPQSRITAVEQSDRALTTARQNAQQLDLTNIGFLQGNWFSSLAQGTRFDVIVSNPPYIAELDPHLGQGDLRFEPHTALASGTDGLDDIQKITAQARLYLQAEGWLLLEHGFDQGESVRGLLARHGFANITTHRDLSGHERVSGGQNA